MESGQLQDKDDQIEKEFTLSNENIKFPTFPEGEYYSYLLNEGMNKDKLKTNLTEIINILKSIIDILKDIILKDKNTFNTLCLKYNLNSYDFVINLTLIQELTTIILSKIDGNNNELKISTLEDFFPKESNENNKEIFDIIKTQYNTIDKDFSIIKSKIMPLFDNLKNLYETKEECGVPYMCYVTKFYSICVDKAKKQLDLFINIENFQNPDSKILRKNMIVYFDLIYLFQKCEMGFFMLYYGYIDYKDDIFNYEENSKEWENLKKVIFRVNCSAEKQIIEAHQKEREKNFNMVVYVNKINPNSNMFFNFTKMAGSAIKYKFMDENVMKYEFKEDNLLSKGFFLLKSVGLTKIRMFKNIMAKDFPPIKLREKVYMKREFSEISLEYIKKLLMKMYDKETILKNFENTVQPEREVLDEKVKSELPLWSSKVKKEDKKYYVSTRLFSSYDLNINRSNEKVPEEKSKFSFFGFFSKNKNNTSKSTINEEIKPKNKDLIIHLHGGGFLDFSTFYCEKYLRETSNEIGIPIISINYGCAPMHQYPEALNDCLQAYMWILEHFEKEFGFKPEKIILSGESAGGHLILTFTLLIIAMNNFDEKKIRIPDLIIALYPVAETDTNNVSLSSFITIDDYFLPLRDIISMKKLYRGYYKNELDPFINPCKAKEELLKDFPSIRFFFGTTDGLRDNNVRFINELAKINGKDVKAYDFNQFDHGFIVVNPEIIRRVPVHLFLKEIKDFIKK